MSATTSHDWCACVCASRMAKWPVKSSIAYFKVCSMEFGSQRKICVTFAICDFLLIPWAQRLTAHSSTKWEKRNQRNKGLYSMHCAHYKALFSKYLNCIRNERSEFSCHSWKLMYATKPMHRRSNRDSSNEIKFAQHSERCSSKPFDFGVLVMRNSNRISLSANRI